ncbi:MAG: toxin-antitoxin system YwqK family antitoxin [Kofleriaceae bacterium]
MLRVLTVLAVLVGMSDMVVAGPRPGANHRAGDDSFVETFGRMPDAHDSEELRMHTHLVWIRAKLGASSATSPQLEARRAELLGYLDDYIAKGVTPKNTYVGWRSPVFIDRDGNVCAVGYLIERSAGRALPERIAAAHRTSFLEDIAASEPAVRAWIASSGLTLDELASIQPAYQEPAIATWKIWAQKYRPDGPYNVEDVSGSGTLKKRHMEGPWKVVDENGTTVGSGTMKRGRGAWTSFYPDGSLRAEGRYARDVAEGTWRIYHPSGNLAAEGGFESGVRVGTWRFFHDVKNTRLLARGRFGADGAVVGRWKHFDAEGNLVATTWEETPMQWNDRTPSTTGGLGYSIAVVPKNGFVERHHIGMPHAREVHTMMLAKGDDMLLSFEVEGSKLMFDVDGNLLEQNLLAGEGAWTQRRCHWSEKRKQVARSGDVARLSGLLFNDYTKVADEKLDDFGGGHSGEYKPECDASVRAVAAERAAVYEELLASRVAVRAPVTFTQVMATHHGAYNEDGEAAKEDPDATAEEKNDARDLVDHLVRGMAMYAEWMHVDGIFEGLFETIPGRYIHHWAGGNPEQTHFEREPS